MTNKLKWEYCEIGNKCHDVQIGGSWYTIYNDLKGSFFLSKDDDPRYSRFAKKFNSFVEADNAAYKMALEGLETTKEALGIRGD